MTKTHWKKLTNPDYLGAYALESGQEIIGTIKSISREVVTGPDGKKEECTIAKFAENIKPMILNSTNCKIIQKMYKTPYTEEWVGRKIQIFVDKVKAFGEVVEALRIRPTIPKQAEPVKDEPINCADCGQVIAAYGKNTAQQMAKYTYDKYGKSVCSDCATKLAEKNKVAEDVLNENN